MTDHDDTAARCRPRGPGSPGRAVGSRGACPRPDQRGRRPARRSMRRGGQLVAYLRPRWVLPVAATVLAVLGATWQSERQVRDRLDDVMTLDASACRSGAARDWGAPEEVVQPVLPPQAYWGMDPFAEFATLRPGTQEHRNTGAQGRRRRTAARRGGRSPTMNWRGRPMPSGLPPIELVSIARAAAGRRRRSHHSKTSRSRRSRSRPSSSPPSTTRRDRELHRHRPHRHRRPRRTDVQPGVRRDRPSQHAARRPSRRSRAATPAQRQLPAHTAAAPRLRRARSANARCATAPASRHRRRRVSGAQPRHATSRST